MALHIENPELERRIHELRGISVEELLRQALDAEEKRLQARYDDVMSFLASSDIYPKEKPMTKEERAEILGYRADGLCSS